MTGQLLDSILQAIDVPREKVYITRKKHKEKAPALAFPARDRRRYRGAVPGIQRQTRCSGPGQASLVAAHLYVNRRASIR